MAADKLHAGIIINSLLAKMETIDFILRMSIIGFTIVLFKGCHLLVLQLYVIQS